MNEQQKLKETLSALLDNEAGKVDQLELRRLVRALEDNPELLATYQRYTLVSATLKGATKSAGAEHRATDFLSGVRAALEQEEMETAEPAVATAAAVNYRWLKPAGRVAIAASVAVLVVLAVQGLAPLPDTKSTATATASASIDPAFTNAAPGTSHRLLNPPVLTVSAGDAQPLLQDPITLAAPTGCALDVVRAGDHNLVWQKPLPEGYVLCKQNDTASACESVSAAVGCYLK